MADPRQMNKSEIQAVSTQVETMAGIGMTLAEIGLVLGETRQTIAHNFSHEYAVGFAKAKAKVAGEMFKMATNQDENIPKNIQIKAAIFWLKCRANWSTVDVVEIKAQVQHLEDPNAPKLGSLKSLNKDELAQLEKIIDKVIGQPRDGNKSTVIDTTGETHPRSRPMPKMKNISNK